MAGRLVDYISSGLAAALPAAATIDAALTTGAAGFYYATDTQTLYCLDRSGTPSWDQIVTGAGSYTPGGTDVALADGGTGASLADPGADRIMFWDDSGGAVTWLEAGAGLSISGTVLSATGASSGTSFPGSPSSGDRYYRTDRNIDYYYDGSQWLSTQLFTLPISTQDSLTPSSATTGHRVVNPWWNEYSFYVLNFKVMMYATATTASNYFVAQLKTADGASTSNLGSTISGQSITQNNYVTQSVAINSSVASTVEELEVTYTETGTASSYLSSIISYRLIG